MQQASDLSVLGRFDGSNFNKDGVASTFYKKDGKFWVRTDGPDGKPADFAIGYTFGVTPLQQYLIELPGGRLQALGIAWDARPASEGGQRWFHLYPDRKLAAGDPLHWMGIDQNWNYQCAWCHSTNVKKHYDPATASFHTTWSEINVGCEACHGPASNHIAWATKPEKRSSDDQKGRGFALSFDERKNVAWSLSEKGQAFRSSTRATSKEIQVCAGCHARRAQFSDDAFDVSRFFDAFRPSLIEPGLHYSDGQQRDEVYNYASFLQSKMHAAGVTCADCHNPHSGKIRLVHNAVCAQCHAAERFDQISHHHHAPESEGALCANCHMPTTVYMGVDRRHDHSMRIPRPDRTQTIGAPNACMQCHTDKSADSAADAIRSWNPAPKLGSQTFAEAFALGESDAPGARVALTRVAEDISQSPIARASALARLARFSSPETFKLATRMLAINDPLIRAAAIPILSHAGVATRRASLAPLLRDEARLVRIDAARALAGEPEQGLLPQYREELDKALAEYIEAQHFNAERPESHANLGALYFARGRIANARAAYGKALEIDRTFIPAAIALAELNRSGGDEGAAETVLRKAHADNPSAAPVVHALGLSLIRQKRIGEATEKLAEATKLEPGEARFAYVFAVALHDTGKLSQAIDVLKNALLRNPYDRDILIALSSYEVETGALDRATDRANLLMQLEPDDKEIQDFATAVKNLGK